VLVLQAGLTDIEFAKKNHLVAKSTKDLLFIGPTWRHGRAFENIKWSVISDENDFWHQRVFLTNEAKNTASGHEIFIFNQNRALNIMNIYSKIRRSHAFVAFMETAKDVRAFHVSLARLHHLCQCTTMWLFDARDLKTKHADTAARMTNEFRIG
jgi:hypothetical protein